MSNDVLLTQLINKNIQGSTKDVGVNKNLLSNHKDNNITQKYDNNQEFKSYIKDNKTPTEKKSNYNNNQHKDKEVTNNDSNDYIKNSQKNDNTIVITNDDDFNQDLDEFITASNIVDNNTINTPIVEFTINNTTAFSQDEQLNTYDNLIINPKTEIEFEDQNFLMSLIVKSQSTNPNNDISDDINLANINEDSNLINLYLPKNLDNADNIENVNNSDKVNLLLQSIKELHKDPEENDSTLDHLMQVIDISEESGPESIYTFDEEDGKIILNNNTIIMDDDGNNFISSKEDLISNNLITEEIFLSQDTGPIQNTNKVVENDLIKTQQDPIIHIQNPGINQASQSNINNNLEARESFNNNNNNNKINTTPAESNLLNINSDIDFVENKNLGNIENYNKVTTEINNIKTEFKDSLKIAQQTSSSNIMEQIQLNIRGFNTNTHHGRILIQLYPEHLGKVEISMNVNHDGRTSMVFAAEKSDTLDLLKQDIRTLEKSLQELGIEADSNNMSFNLKQDNSNQERYINDLDYAYDSSLDNINEKKESNVLYIPDNNGLLIQQGLDIIV